MSSEVIGLIGLVAMLALMALRFPLGISFALVGGVGTILLRGLQPGLSAFSVIPYSWMSSYSLSVLPMFIMLGLLLSYTGMAEELFSAAHKWLGRLPGGLAIATLVVTALFSAISGSSVAAASAISKICYPEMKKHKYDSGLASGVIAAGCTMDIMIPPSIAMVILALLLDQSVGGMFLAGFGPGALEVVLFAVFVVIMVKRNPSLAPIPFEVKTPILEKIRSTKSVVPIALIFLSIFGGIYGGIFTPTEAGAVGVMASVVVALVMRRLTWPALKGSLSATLRLTGNIFFILVGNMFFNTFIAVSGLSNALTRFVTDLGVSATVFLIIVLLLYLVLGALMEELSMFLLTIPLLFPVVVALGIDPLHFGILIILAWQIGMIAPPVGLLAFVTKSQLPDVSIQTVYKGCIPFLIALVIVEAIVLFVPDVALFLVRASAAR